MRLIIVLFIFIASFVSAQKLYIVCPDTFYMKPKLGFLDNKEIDVVFFDNRVMPKKVKDECSFESLQASITKSLRKAYPSAKINYLKPDKFYSMVDTNKITLKISVKFYGFTKSLEMTSSFGNRTGYGIATKNTWVCLTAYDLTLFDYTNTGYKKTNFEIVEQINKQNNWGKKDGIKGLNESFQKSVQHIVSILDKYFLE